MALDSGTRGTTGRRIFATVGLAVTALAGCAGGGTETGAVRSDPGVTGTSGGSAVPGDAGRFTVTSAAFEDGRQIPERLTCDGAGLSPALSWSGAPMGTEQLALVVDDPDAPGGTFTHWVVWGIDPADGATSEGAVPEAAIEGENDFGETSYGGPCPPSETHRYRFELLALSGSPDIDAGASATDLRDAVDGMVLDTAVLTGTYAG